MRTLIPLLVFILITFFSAAQQTDTAFTNVARLPDDSVKAKRLYSSGLKYTNLKPELSLPLADSCEKISKKINWLLGIVCANHIRGVYHERHGNFKKAIEYYTLSYDLGVKIKNIRAQVIRSNDIANVYATQGKYKEAADHYLRSIKIAEQAKMTNSQSYSYLGLGGLFREQKNYSRAEKYYNDALKIAQKNGDKKIIAACYNNLGIVSGDRGSINEAIQFHLKALEIKKELNDLFGIGITYEMLANKYAMADDYKKAIEYGLNSLDIARQLGNKDSEAETLCNLGSYYLEAGKLQEAEKTLNESIKVAKEIDYRYLMQESFRHLSRLYALKNDFKKAYDFNLKYTEIKDSILNKESTKQVAEMEARFENEKNELEIKNLNSEKALQKTEIEKKEAEVKRQNLQKIAFACGFVLMLALAGLIFKGYNEKKKSNLIISEQKIKVELQKNIIEEKQREVMDSINYAKRIQQTVLASDSFLEQHLSPENFFVLFKPKDIVSGDFYWATEAEPSSLQDSATNFQPSAFNSKLFYLAVCDSTGHGVPGAFMSLLNIAYLSEAINEKGIHEPNEVFDYVRRRLINSVNKDGQKDGFDGILLKLAYSNNHISASYAAAFNAPLLISGNQAFHQPCDKMPVGIGEKNDHFTHYQIPVQKGDTIYLYTDGYADQFGGPKGKKFKYKQLEDLLCSIHQLSVKEQKEKLEKAFEDWRGYHEQIDDVCVIGIKV